MKSEYYSVYKNSPFKIQYLHEHASSRVTIIKTIAEVSTYIWSATLFQKSTNTYFDLLIVNRSSCRSRLVRVSLCQLFCWVVKPTRICIVSSLHSRKCAAMDERWTWRDRHQVRPRKIIHQAQSQQCLKMPHTAKTPQWKEALGASPLLRCALKLDKLKKNE